MGILNFNKPEIREFDYKPRYYTPEEEQPTGDHKKDFADTMHREWSSKRRHTKGKSQTSWLTIMTMLFFAVVLGLILYFFFK